MLCVVYLGRLDDPSFHWDGGDVNGNVPRRLSPFFPGGYYPFSQVIRRIEAGIYDGKQTDFGGWVARVNVAQVRAFVDEVYSYAPTSDAGSLRSQPSDDLSKLRQYLDTLEPASLVALVAAES